MVPIVRIVLLCVVSMLTVLSEPTGHQNENVRVRGDCWLQREETTDLSSQFIDDVTCFIKSWLESLATILRVQRASQSGDPVQSEDTTSLLVQHSSPREDLVQIENRNNEDKLVDRTPEISPQLPGTDEISFEVYEKRYLINQTVEFLKQLLRGQDEHLSHTVTPLGISTSRPPVLDPSAAHVSVLSTAPVLDPTTAPGLDQSIASVPTATSGDLNRATNLKEAIKELNAMSLPRLQQLFLELSRPSQPLTTKIPLSSLCCLNG